MRKDTIDCLSNFSVETERRSVKRKRCISYTERADNSFKVLLMDGSVMAGETYVGDDRCTATLSAYKYPNRSLHFKPI